MCPVCVLSSFKYLAHLSSVRSLLIDVPAPWIVLEYLLHGDLKSFLSVNKRPLPRLVKYMVDVSMGMHYLSERGLVHRVWFILNVRFVRYMRVIQCSTHTRMHTHTHTHTQHTHYRISQPVMFWLAKTKPVKLLTLVSFESFLKTTHSITCRPTYLVQFDGCLQRASQTGTSQQPLMFGALGSCCGRFLIQQRHPMKSWETLRSPLRCVCGWVGGGWI